MLLLYAVEASSLVLFLFFGAAMLPPSMRALFSRVNCRLDNRIDCSSARVAGPSISIIDDKLNAPRISLVQLKFVLNDDDEEDETSK